MAGVGRNDWILCQITSNPYSDPQAVLIADENFAQGSLQRISYVRPGKLFTANRRLMVAQVGMLSAKTLKEIIDRIVEILRSELHAPEELLGG